MWHIASFQLRFGLRMSPWRASQFLHGKHQLDLYRGPATNACPHIRLPHTRVCFALDIDLVLSQCAPHRFDVLAILCSRIFFATLAPHSDCRFDSA